MLRRSKWHLAAVASLCFASACEAQTPTVTTITATGQQWGGSPLAAGQLVFFGVTPAGRPQTFSANGKLYPAGNPLALSGGLAANIVNGSLSAAFSVPDKAAASAAYPLCYDVWLVNTTTHEKVDLGTRCDITGTTVSMDTYVPPVVTPTYIAGFAHGTAANLPPHCAAGATYNADDTHHFYACGLDGVFHDETGTGGGSGVTPRV